MTSNQQDPLRPIFEAWASLNLPRSYSLALEEGDYDEATRVVFSAFKAGLKKSDGFRAGIEQSAAIAEGCMWGPKDVRHLIARDIRAGVATTHQKPLRVDKNGQPIKD
jgi:hypothetical protein